MDEMRAAIEARIALLQKEQAQAIAQVNMLAGGIHELQQLLGGFDQPDEAPTELVREVA